MTFSLSITSFSWPTSLLTLRTMLYVEYRWFQLRSPSTALFLIPESALHGPSDLMITCLITLCKPYVFHNIGPTCVCAMGKGCGVVGSQWLHIINFRRNHVSPTEEEVTVSDIPWQLFDHSLRSYVPVCGGAFSLSTPLVRVACFSDEGRDS